MSDSIAAADDDDEMRGKKKCRTTKINIPSGYLCLVYNNDTNGFIDSTHRHYMMPNNSREYWNRKKKMFLGTFAYDKKKIFFYVIRCETKINFI